MYSYATCENTTPTSDNTEHATMWLLQCHSGCHDDARQLLLLLSPRWLRCPSTYFLQAVYPTAEMTHCGLHGCFQPERRRTCRGVDTVTHARTPRLDGKIHLNVLRWSSTSREIMYRSSGDSPYHGRRVDTVFNLEEERKRRTIQSQLAWDVFSADRVVCGSPFRHWPNNVVPLIESKPVTIVHRVEVQSTDKAPVVHKDLATISTRKFGVVRTVK